MLQNRQQEDAVADFMRRSLAIAGVSPVQRTT